MRVPQETLDRVQALYDRGLMLQAYEAARADGPLRSWQGRNARILAGRLASNLGAQRLSCAMHSLAWRENRTSASTQCYHGRGILNRWGPLAAWEFLRGRGEPEGDAEERGTGSRFTPPCSPV